MSNVVIVAGFRNAWKNQSVSPFSIFTRAVDVIRDDADLPAAVVTSSAVLLSEGGESNRLDWFNYGDAFAVPRLKYCNSNLRDVYADKLKTQVSPEVLWENKTSGPFFIHLTEATVQWLEVSRRLVGPNGFVMVSDYRIPQVREICDTEIVLTGSQHLYLTTTRGHIIITGLLS